MEKELDRQTDDELFSEAAAILGLEPFRDLCAALNKEHALEVEDRLLLSKIADAMGKSPARELRAALAEIANYVHECEVRTQLSPLCAKSRRRLTKLDYAINLMASVLKDNEMAEGMKTDDDPATSNSGWIDKTRRALLTARDGYGVCSPLECRGTPADAWSHIGPVANGNTLDEATDQASQTTSGSDRVADALEVKAILTVACCHIGAPVNDNISVRETEEAQQLIFGADRVGTTPDTKEIAAPVGRDAKVSINPGRENKVQSQIAVEGWVARKLATISQRPHKSRELATARREIQRTMRSVRFLTKVEALFRRPRMMIGLDGRVPSGPVRVPADTGIGQILQSINAQWVRELDLVSLRGMRALSQGIKSFSEYYLQPRQGSRKLTDQLGPPRGRQACGLAAIRLFEVMRHSKPGYSNAQAQRLCAVIWRMAGFGVLPGQEGTDNNDSGWSRHLRPWTGNVTTIWECHILISDVFRRNGLSPQVAPRRMTY